MRSILAVAAVAVIAIVLGAGVARADEPVAGAYDVKYEEMSNNCDRVGMALARGTLKIEVHGNALQVDIERIPLMSGLPAKTGKINAKTPRAMPTSIQGLDGMFSVAGRVNDGMLQLVFVAEYSAKGRGAICTQSWNISGLRQDKTAK
jgi:hypothetical protein